jgi:hypothetical protein
MKERNSSRRVSMDALQLCELAARSARKIEADNAGRVAQRERTAMLASAIPAIRNSTLID